MRVVWIALLAGCGFQTPGDPGAGSEAEVFDTALCPPSYSAALPGPSRYRLIIESHRAWEQSNVCKLDLDGATHLAVLDTPEELAAVAALVDATGNLGHSAAYVGGVQLPTASSPRDAWLWLDGTPLIDGWAPPEPNDVGGDESDHEEQFVKIERTRHYLIDIGGGEGNGALCECDGKPIAATADSAITANIR